MAYTNSTQTILSDKKSDKYDAFWLLETKTKADPDGIGRGEMRLIGQFPSHQEAEAIAREFLHGTTGAVGYLVRKARQK